MYEHLILLHSDYSEGKRIALHRVHLSVDGLNDFKLLINRLKEHYPQLSFGFHHIKTESRSWESVVEYDKFFSDVFPVKDIDTFNRFLADEEDITSLDIANLITSKTECTHLKLQKLLYFFYCKYLKKHSKAPFKEKIVAWAHGPVVEEVYERYKAFGRSKIDGRHEEDDQEPIRKADDFKLSVYSRFMKSPALDKYLETLDETLDEYGKYSAWDLVELTHRPGTPWSVVTDNGRRLNRTISAELIREYVESH